MTTDDLAKLRFFVHRRDQIVAAFARRTDAGDLARYQSENYGCRCTVSTVDRALGAYENGESVDA
jgi:hypothetical protein